jgi:hypothetical protein
MKHIASLIVIILGIILRGFVLAALWEWFMVPMGAPMLTPTHALGVSMLVAYLTIDLTVKREQNNAGAVAVAGLTVSLFVIACGYIVHRVMVP